MKKYLFMVFALVMMMALPIAVSANEIIDPSPIATTGDIPPEEPTTDTGDTGDTGHTSTKHKKDKDGKDGDDSNGKKNRSPKTSDRTMGEIALILFVVSGGILYLTKKEMEA